MVMPSDMNQPILIVLDKATLTKDSLGSLFEAFRGFPLILRHLPKDTSVLLRPSNLKVGGSLAKVVRMNVERLDTPCRVVPSTEAQYIYESIPRHLVEPHAQEGFSDTDIHSQLSQEARGFSNDPHDTPFDYGNSTGIKSTAPPGISVGKLYQGPNEKGSITQCWTKSAQVADIRPTQSQTPSKEPNTAAYWITKQERRADLNKSRPMKRPSSGPAHWS
jgi:hypothetical protein